MNALTIIANDGAQEINHLIEAAENFDHNRNWTAKGALAALERLPGAVEVSQGLAVLEHTLATPAPMATLVDLVDGFVHVQSVTVTPQYRAFLSTRLERFPEVAFRAALEEVLSTVDGKGSPIAVGVVLTAAERHVRRLREAWRKLGRISWSIRRLQVIAGGGGDPDELPF